MPIMGPAMTSGQGGGSYSSRSGKGLSEGEASNGVAAPEGYLWSDRYKKWMSPEKYQPPTPYSHGQDIQQYIAGTGVMSGGDGGSSMAGLKAAAGGGPMDYGGTVFGGGAGGIAMRH